ncbi:MAG: hypothetical protein OXF27_17390 [Acidobacteria bacterium]|nr:hypothetical protein [Acidobacteriota bacterium]
MAKGEPKRIARRFLVSVAAVALCAAAGVLAQPVRGTAALAVHDRYLAAWNAQDADAFAATLHYPHARQAPGAPGSTSWQGAEEYAAGMDFGPLIARGWVHSYWDARSVVQVDSGKVHVAARARRVDAAGQTIQTVQTLYVITEHDGRWGVQARFSVGPPATGRVADASRKAAVAAVEAYLDAVNRRDAQAFAATMHYPHYRITRAGQVQAWEGAREVASTMTFDRLASTGWVRTAAHNVNPVLVSADAVNVALELLRYNAAGEQIARFDTLYLVTREDGRWAFKGRSSFAPR